MRIVGLAQTHPIISNTCTRNKYNTNYNSTRQLLPAQCNRWRMEAFLSKKKALTVQSDRVWTNGTPGPSFASNAEAKFTHTQCLSTSTSFPAESQYPASLHNTEFSTHSPVGNRTRSHSQKSDVQTSGEPVCIGLDPTPT